MGKSSEVKKTRVRDAEATRRRILRAARREFAKLGLGGARVDTIAERAKANKRMIYHYFGSKESLFTAVLEDAYLGIREAEKKLNLTEMEPDEAIDELVRFTWGYYLKHPEFLSLVNSENLHKARHLRKSESVRDANKGFVELVQTIIAEADRQVDIRAGVFRPGLQQQHASGAVLAQARRQNTARIAGTDYNDVVIQRVLPRRCVGRSTRLRSMLEIVARPQ